MKLVKDNWQHWLWKEAQAIAFYGCLLLLGYLAFRWLR